MNFGWMELRASIVNKLIKPLENNINMNIFYKPHIHTDLKIKNRLLEIRSAFLFRLLHHLRAANNVNNNNKKRYLQNVLTRK